jgi:hypothetical protein
MKFVSPFAMMLSMIGACFGVLFWLSVVVCCGGGAGAVRRRCAINPSVSFDLSKMAHSLYLFAKIKRVKQASKQATNEQQTS